jgi:hypothetical protein
VGQEAGRRAVRALRAGQLAARSRDGEEQASEIEAGARGELLGVRDAGDRPNVDEAVLEEHDYKQHENRAQIISDLDRN